MALLSSRLSCIHRHIPVAIKILLRVSDSLADEDVNRNISILRSVRHPHVITFYGAGLNSEQRPYLVTELMTRGSLKTILWDTAQSLDWPVRLRFANDIALGMEYIHSIGMVTRSLKPDNCFVNANLRVKVCPLSGRQFHLLHRTDHFHWSGWECWNWTFNVTTSGINRHT